MFAATPALVCAVALAGAQDAPQPAELHGAVQDASGAGIPNADVVVYREGVTVAHVTTDQSGSFMFKAPPREYRVIVRAPSFPDLRSGPVPFLAGSSSRFNLTTFTDPVVTPAAPSTGVLHESAVRQVADATPWEFGAQAEGGVGIGDRSSYRFFNLGGHAGKVLTGQAGSGLLQGNFEYGVEVLPFWQSYTPRFQKLSCSADPPAPFGSYTCSQQYTVGGTFTGVSITPIILRWNFTHGQRVMPWVQGAGGLLWTDHKYPAIGNLNAYDTATNGPHGDTSVWNFTPQFGIGAHYFVRPRRSLDLGANAVHISSASLGDKNPGVNASVQFSLGFSWWK